MREAAPRATLVHASGVPFAICTIAVLAWLVGLLQPLDNWLVEQRFRLTSKAPTGQVVLVALDAKSLAAFGTWPLPRSIYGAVVDSLRALDAGDIALDIDFSAPSVADEDAWFAAALARAGGNVILAGFNQKLTAGFGEEQLAANRPIADFADKSWLGGAGVHPDPDGVVRSFGYGETIAGEPVPSVPALLAAAGGTIGASFVVDFGIRADQIDQIPAVDLLQGNVDRARVAGKKVIIGATAAELRDFFQVPRFGPIPGALLEAVSADTLLQHRPLAEVGILPIAILLGLVALMFALVADRVAWVFTLAGLGVAAVALEGAALVVQMVSPTIVATAAADLALFSLAIAITLREATIRGVLVFWTGRELGNARTILDQVIADSFAGILIVDERGRVESASRSVGTMLGGGDGKRELVGKSLVDVAPVELAEACKAAIMALESNRWYRREPAELKVRDGEGHVRTFEYVATPSQLSAVMPRAGSRDRLVCCLTLLDVTDRREAEARLDYLANFDPVTGLANRRQFNQRLGKMLAGHAGGRCAVICLDLDRFKNVNDTLGHRVGDLLLQQVAARASAVIGKQDLVARLGGDEYAVVLADCGSESDIVRFTASLVDRLGQPYVLQGHRVIIGASAGVALAWLGKNPQELMKNADTALYRAKAEGGNCFRMFEPSMDASLRARQALEVDCWDAMERGEFQLYYQPQVDLSDGHITGVEALLRWKHPVRGFISPADFVPIAEDTGLIETLGAWVLNEACREVASWPGELKVAVNVSPVQFQRGDLVKTVREALAKSGLPPERLDLEITESLFITQNATVTATVQALREIGISFSLDDFGTGYSSLSYLRKFPVNKIKIDKSFVFGIPKDREALAVIRAVATLAQSLGIRMNAEGIEEEPQVHLLRALGCTEGQGYFFGRPAPAEQIVKLLSVQPAILPVRPVEAALVPLALESVA